jgi:hypothetical protein
VSLDKIAQLDPALNWGRYARRSKKMDKKIGELW